MKKTDEVLFWLTINETVGERGLLPFFDEKESLECFCPVVSHIYVGESKVQIVYITNYTETVRIDNMLYYLYCKIHILFCY
jgi:hypothetical protein